MPAVGLRAVRLNGSAALSDLAWRGKAEWGYDPAFMARCRGDMTVRRRMSIGRSPCSKRRAYRSPKRLPSRTPRTPLSPSGICHGYHRPGLATIGREPSVSIRRRLSPVTPEVGKKTMYLEKYDLKGRVAVITGGGRGIGFASAQALAECGAHVVIAEIDAVSGPKAAENLKAMGYACEYVGLDVTKPAEVTRLADDLQARHGRIDILVANAGIAKSSPGEAASDEEWNLVVDINLNGVYWCNRAFGKHMLARGAGSIVNLGSMSGIISNKPQPQSHYNASKAAVHMLTKSLAGEWAPRGVRVNAVAPTYIETEMTRGGRENPEWLPTWLEMTPMHRCGEAHEIASAVLFLASDASSLMTGSVVVVDGGYTIW
jgi:NAD(P)-dependent dehydrogenase (short-subunit alcohol dehydrogenase family)